ncbi:MAG: fibronectin-binding domain-containing protein [Ruminococcaceae bacterium]|nr:fibronectin-binding domain-containing protein [Oscillospiraceae bacterium]
MPFDAVYMSALKDELSEVLPTSRIDKINQPERDELIFNLRTPQGNKKLLISANPSAPRIHFTEMAAENPITPPMFCMLMRKHLGGARIKEITQPGLERVLIIKLDSMDEMGQISEKQLVFEALGRQSNLILVGSDGRIIDSVRRADGDMTSKRAILPGMFYRLPEKQEKLQPDEVTCEQIRQLLDEATGVQADKWIMSTFAALPPLLCRELAYRHFGEVDARLDSLDEAGKDRFTAELYSFFEFIARGRKTPVMLVDSDGAPKDICYTEIGQYEGLYVNKIYDNFSQLTESFYGLRDSRERMRSRSSALRKTITNLYDRTARRVENQRRELEATADRERDRQKGDLLMANLGACVKGRASVTVTDLFDPDGKDVEIALDPKLSPQQNAAKYYKAYAKAKNAEKYLTGLIADGEKELEYLGSVLDEIDRAGSETELQEIRQELVSGGYVRNQKTNKKEKFRKSKPMSFVSSSGFEISVGRNNTQNDELTTKTAFKSDIWLHTQKIHGSHVIIHCRGQQPDDETVTEAAILAAYYSQARDGKNVPVDYTPVKFVKKPNGAKPGMVIYETYRTAYVTPDEKLVEALGKENK